MADNVVEVIIRSKNRTKAGIDEAKKDAEEGGDDAGRSWTQRFGQAMSDGMSGVFGRSKDESGKAGEDAGGFWHSRFTQTVIGGLAGTLITGIGSALAVLPALGAVGGVALAGALAIGVASKIPSVGKQLDALGKTVMHTLVAAVRPILPVIHSLLSQVSGFVKSMGPEFAQLFKAVAPAMLPLTHGLEQLVANVFPGFVALLHAAMPAVTAFAKVLSGLGQNIGSMFQAFAPALAASAKAMSALFSVIGGLLPVIAHLAGIAASALAPALSMLAGAFRALGPVISIVGHVLSGFAAAFVVNLAGGLKAVAGLVRAVQPAFLMLAHALGQVFTELENRGVFNDVEDAIEALVPVLGKMVSELITGLIPILPVLVTLLADAAQILQAGLVSAVTALSAVLVPLIPAITAVARVIADVLAAGLQAVVPLLVRLAPVILAIVAAVKLWSIAQTILDAVMDANPIGLLVIAIVGLIGAVVELVRHWHDVENVAKTVWRGVLDAVRAVWNWIKSNWPYILGILLGPVAMAAAIIYKHFDTIKRWVADAIGFIRDHWKLILEILTGPVGIATMFIIEHWNTIVHGAQTMVHDLISFFESLPGKIMTALSHLASDMFTAGKDAILGLVHGAESLLGDVANIGADIGHTLESAFKSVLHIGSPSKVMYDHGRNIALGLIGGMESMRGQVAAAAGRMGTAASLTGHPALAGASGSGAGGALTLDVRFAGSDSQIINALWPHLKLEVRTKGGGGPYSAQKALGSTWPRGA